MRMLAGTQHNVCAVGDEDQSIYSWRGADIRNILEFENDFPEAKIIRLEQNYRSTQNILQAASAVVANNVKRKGKNLWTSRQGGAKIGYYEAPDGENEALFVADYISRYLREAAEQGDNPRAAVLYRTNSQSRLFEEAMRRYQLKYHVVGGFSFYERAEIKDLISYLKVIHNPDDSISLLRVINTPARGIGKTTMETIERLALETGLSLWGAIGETIRRQLSAAARFGRAEKLSRFDRRCSRHAGAAHMRSDWSKMWRERPRPRKQTMERRGVPPVTTEASGQAEETDFDPENFSFDFGEQRRKRFPLRRRNCGRSSDREAMPQTAVSPFRTQRRGRLTPPTFSSSSSTAPATSSCWKMKTRPKPTPALRTCANWSMPPWIPKTAAKPSTSFWTMPPSSAMPMDTTNVHESRS